MAGVGLFAQLEDCLGLGLVARCVAPEDVLLSPPGHGEKYVRLGNGTMVIVSPSEGKVQRVFPPGYDPTHHAIINHTIDRGSVGVAVLSVCGWGGPYALASPLGRLPRWLARHA